MWFGGAKEVGNTMTFPKRDIIATCAVAAAVVLYLLWLADVALLDMSSARGTGLAILVLGFVASATAVVPSFNQLMHGNKAYVATTSLLGLVALVSGIVVLWLESSAALGMLVAVLLALWGISTIHHVLLARAEKSASPSEAVPASHPEHAGVG